MNAWLKVPRSSGAECEGDMNTKDGKPPGDMSALVVEDNPTHAEIIDHELQLREPTFGVTRANSCLEAYHALDANTFDCVLLDHHLPDGDATDVLLFIGRRGIRVPVIVVTTSSDETTMTEVIRAGCTRFACKHSVFKTKGELHRLTVSAIRDFRKAGGVQAIVKTKEAASKPVEINSRLRVTTHSRSTVIVVKDRELFRPKVISSVSEALFAVVGPLENPRVTLKLNRVEGFGARFASKLRALVRLVESRDGELVLSGLTPAVRQTCAVVGLTDYIRSDERNSVVSAA